MENKIEISSLFQYDTTVCPPDWLVEETYSQFHRVYYIYSGEAIYESADEKFSLAQDTLYFFPIFKEYKISHNPAQPLNCLWFHINLNHTLMNNTFKITIIMNSTEFYTLKLLECLTKDQMNIYNVKATLNVLLSLIEKHEQFTFVSNYRIDKVLHYIHENYGCKLSNRTLANLINIDHRYFIRLFRLNCGRTPQEYIAYYKAFQAGHLLIKGFSVSDVSEMTGFEDPKAFSRFFKSHKGTPPSEYKKSYYLQP